MGGCKEICVYFSSKMLNPTPVFIIKIGPFYYPKDQKVSSLFLLEPPLDLELLTKGFFILLTNKQSYYPKGSFIV